MFFANFIPIFVLLPLGWCTQVRLYQCDQPVNYEQQGLASSHRQTRHLQHHRSSRRHRIRGTKEFAPHFIDQPSDLIVRKDHPATLNCQAEGNPKPKIEWYRNGEYVDINKDSRHTLYPDGSLFFFRLNQGKGKSDEGVYTCVASNRLGTISSRNASLYIAALREDFRLNPSDTFVAVGKSFVIECQPPKGLPEPTVTWKKDGDLINQNNTRYTVSSGKLTISSAVKTDSGIYVCVASNQAGERESKAAQISVLEKPVITNKPSDVVARSGSAVQFMCGTQGDPKPTVRWTKEHGELPHGRYEISSENTLKIQFVRTHDAGKYICTAENRLESVSYKASLVVEDPLDTGQMDKDIHRELSNVRIYLDNITALPSASVYVHWKVFPSSPVIEGYSVLHRPHPSSDPEWNEWRSSRSNEYSTIVSSLRRGQRYEFKVRPFSGKIYGAESNVKHFKVPEEVPNSAPQNIEIATVDANGTIVVSWDPPPKSIHSGHIKGYKVSCLGNETHHQAEWTVDEGTKRLEIPMLVSGIKYQVQVAAINDAGIGTPSKPKYIFIESPEVKAEKQEDNLSFETVLQVMRHPAFIATAGSVTWILLMMVAIYVCQRHSKRYRTKKHSALGNGLYRFASEDTIIKHRMDTTDSPWLSNTWKSCSKNYSSTTSMNSQLLWTETKDTIDFRKSKLHHANSAPLSPYCQTSNQSNSIPSVQSLDINQVGKGEYAKVMKTFSSPKILQYTTSLKVMDLLPVTSPLPPPPVPPPEEDSAHKFQGKMVSNLPSYSESKPENDQQNNHFNRRKLPPDTLNWKRSSASSISFSMNDEGDNVLTPEDVAKYLELSEQGDMPRHQSECDASLPRNFSSPHTYGYICSPFPSELVETETVDEDDDLEMEDVNSLKSFRKYCETPTSSISEYESSMAGSLVNGWGSVSEDNFTSARCSMVSSSDGSFLMDANFAKALAVAVDSFCYGMSQAEASGRDRLYTDFSPPSSPLDGMLANPNNHGENSDATKKNSKVCPLPVLDWNIDWMDEMEAKYSQKHDLKRHFPFDKKMEPFK
ncbi:roundabout homolog 4 isoform 3-T3 [Discoglossus pictus]